MGRVGSGSSERREAAVKGEQVQDEALIIQEEQGWTDDTVRGLALAFIFDHHGCGNDFNAFLRSVAENENGEVTD